MGGTDNGMMRGLTAGTTSVTVAVCTRNRGDRIVETVASVLDSDLDTFELLVVDQSAGDETEIALRPFDSDSRFRYLRSSSVGIGMSRHLAVEMASGEYVAFTDDDCTVPPDWLSTVVRSLDEHPDVGMLFCTVRPAPFDPNLGFVPIYERAGVHLVRTAFGKCRARGIGAGMAVRRNAAIAVGSFDQALGSRFPGVVGEEGDLALRLILAGYPVLETDRTHVIHDGFRTWQQGKDLTRRNFVGIGLVCAKPVKCGRISALSVVLYEGVWTARLRPLSGLFRGRRPHIRGFFHFWRGFVTGLRTPVDRRTVNFRLTD